MTNQKNRSPFLMLQRSKITEELLQKPDCFALLTQIALRAKRSDDFNLHNLQIGESFIGDYQRAGLTEQRYRTAKNNLSKWGFATFRATNKGTVATLVNSTIFSYSKIPNNGQADSPATDEQRSSNGPTTTNHTARRDGRMADHPLAERRGEARREGRRPWLETFPPLPRPFCSALGRGTTNARKPKICYTETASKSTKKPR